MNKKIPEKDLKVWIEFTKKMDNVENKDIVYDKPIFFNNSVYILDLHGFSLLEANNKVKNCINESYINSIRYIKIITGKGNRSNNISDPYQSQSLSILKNSVPDFIKKNEELMKKIIEIKPATTNDGGGGAFYLLLKKYIKE